MPKPFDKQKDGKPKKDRDFPVRAPEEDRQVALEEVALPTELQPPPEETSVMTLPDIQQMILQSLDSGMTPEEIISQIMSVGREVE